MVLLLGGATTAGSAPPEGWFPFALPPYGAQGSLVDLSWLSPEPAGAAGFVTVQEGHFVDGWGRRLRLLGTNFTFGQAFPAKDEAPRIAFRLRQLGMNVARFHHMDNQVAPRGIWAPGFSTLDPQQLDRLDWFVYQLKQHGVYVNLNLHVSHIYSPDIRKLDRAFRYGKGLDNFFPEFIEKQRHYARMLLTHRNPYTKTTYAEEPAVLCVELNNENSLLRKSRSVLASLPPPYGPELTRQWQAWLKKRYGTTTALRKKWDALAEPLGKELLANRDFTQGTTGWTLEVPPPARGTMRVVAGPRQGTHALRCELTHLGTQSWHFQLHQTGLDLKDGQAYTVSFQAKADPPRRFAMNVRMDCPPWKMVGLNERVSVTREWRRFNFTFKCKDPKPEHSRVSFTFGNTLGVCWVADVSLRPGGFIGLPKGQSLEAGTVTLPPPNASPAALADFWRFRVDTERRYVTDMRDYVKNDLHVHALVTDTQASYGGIAGAWCEATLTGYVDMHGYWQHPHFPGRPWDPGNWRIPNTPMVANPNGGTLYGRAVYRVADRPFTVSEYDHPAPSDYVAEMFPVIASFAALQDWDAVYQFCYGRAGESAETTRLNGYFSLAPHPAKLVFVPVAALMLRARTVVPAAAQAILEVPESRIWSGPTSADALWNEAGFGPQEMLSYRLALRFKRQGNLTLRKDRTSGPSSIHWDATDPRKALYTVNAPAVRTVTGFLGGRQVQLGDVTIAMDKTPRNWTSIALAALDAKPLTESKRMLLVAVGGVENTDMGWNANRTTVGRKWGKPPIIAEGIPATVTVPGRVRVHALTPAGRRAASVSTETVPGNRSRLHVGPEYRTLWYLVER